MQKKIKLLLLLLNKQGKEINYETKTYYSKKFEAMLTSHTLKFWHKKKQTTEDKEKGIFKYYCTTKDFKSSAALIKYLIAIKDGIEDGKEN